MTKPDDTQNNSFQNLQIPEIYANAANVNFSPFEFEITLGLASSNYQGVKPVVNIRLSPQFAREFASILYENVRIYADKFGLPPATDPSVKIQ